MLESLPRRKSLVPTGKTFRLMNIMTNSGNITVSYCQAMTYAAKWPVFAKNHVHFRQRWHFSIIVGNTERTKAITS